MSTVEAENYNKYDLEMVDSDFGSWEQGDKLVIASTDTIINRLKKLLLTQ